MKSKTIKFFLAAVTATLLAVSVRSADTNDTSKTEKSDKTKALFEDKVIARGKGVEVKQSQIDSQMVSIRSAAAASGQPLPPTQATMYERQVFENLVSVQLLTNQATDADKAKGKENSVKLFELLKKRAGDEEALIRQLKSVGMSEDDLHAKLLQEATAQAVLERSLKAEVTDADVKKFYDDPMNAARFEQPDMVRVQHILIGTRDPDTGRLLPDDQKDAKYKLAKDVLKRARDGEDFTKLVKEYTDDIESKAKDGEYTFPRASAETRRGMPPEFESAAFSLNVNQISDIVTTDFGYHIIKLLEKIPAKKLEYDKVAETLKDRLSAQAQEKQLPAYMKKLREEANLEVLDDKYKPKKVDLDDWTPPEVSDKADDKKSDDKKSDDKH